MNKINEGIILIETGFSIRKTERLLKLNKQELIELKQLKIKLKKEQFNESKIEHICELYKEGVSAKQLGYKYTIDKRRVQKWAKEKGLLRSKEEANKTIQFDQHSFDKIDTPTKAYWLGFFYADAYNSDKINTFTLTLKRSDYGHLHKLADFISLSRDEVFIDDALLDGLPLKGAACNIKMYSKHICTKMTELGCPRAKSFIIKYPEWLSSDLDRHFIRGLFDGDGCISGRKEKKSNYFNYKWSLVGTKECCEKVQSIINEKLNTHINMYYISKTKNNTYVLETAGNRLVTTVMKWLYEDTLPEHRLDRKYERYIRLMNKQPFEKY